jgi:hypothetical protein
MNRLLIIEKVLLSHKNMKKDKKICYSNNRAQLVTIEPSTKVISLGVDL